MNRLLFSELLYVARWTWFGILSLLFMVCSGTPTDNIPPDTLIDLRDGKKYRIVNIGNKTWMAENLNFEAGNSRCYDNEDSSCQKYGRLYDWNTAMEICPAGWRLPSFEDWSELLFNVAGGYCNAAKFLKSTTGWAHDGNGIDSFGFSALPSSNLGKDGNWWSATEENRFDFYAVSLLMFSWDDDIIFQSNTHKSDLFSVRCVSTSLLPVASTDKSLPETVTTGNKQAQTTDFQEIITDTLIDLRDEKKYRTVKIGNDIWMAENLNFEAENSWCYDDVDSYCQKYGRLYDWNAAMKVCPAGWRLPDTADWNNLARAAGGQYNYPVLEFFPTYWTVADLALKSTTGWHSGGNGTDQFGFSALPGGVRNPLNQSTLYGGVGFFGYWCTATEGSGSSAWYDDSAWYWFMRECRKAKVVDLNKNRAASVRCIQK